MKKMRFVLAMVLVLALLAAAPLSALAATWEAETSDDVANAFYNDTDAEVIVNLKNDINMDHDLHTGAGQNYTINGNGNQISDVSIFGNGSTEINADVTSVDNSVALHVMGTAEVTVNGNVTGADATESGDYGTEGVAAIENAKVTINGDVTGGDGYLNEEDMQDPTEYSDGGDGVYAYENAQVTVNGNVSGGDSMGTYAWGGDGICVEDHAKVEVTGDVTGGDVTADPDVEAVPDLESRGGNGIHMYGDSQVVVVGGNVTAGNTNGDAGFGGDGIRMNNSLGGGSVEVGGTVAAGEGQTDGYAINLGETEYDICLEDALAATPEEILEEFLAAMEAGNEMDTKCAALEMAMELMQENGDLTDEEFAAFEEARDRLFAESETEEKGLLAVLALAQETVEKEASSDNLLELDGSYIDISVGDLKGESTSEFGSRSTELYATDGRGASGGSNPQTGEAPTVLIIGAVMLVCLMGMGALIITRKKSA